jgi:hypothetical protein
MDAKVISSSKPCVCVRCGYGLRNIIAIIASALRRDADIAENLPKELFETTV